MRTSESALLSIIPGDDGLMSSPPVAEWGNYVLLGREGEEFLKLPWNDKKDTLGRWVCHLDGSLAAEGRD